MQDQLKILVVDDDALDRRAVRQALQQRHPQGEIQEVTCCAEASDALRAQTFDCVFLDYKLPDCNGVSFISDLREAGNNTPIIMLTSYGDANLAAEAITAGATDYLPKDDLSAPLLDHCLRSALRFHQSQEEMRLSQEQAKRSEELAKQAQEELRLREGAIAASSNGIIIADPHQPDCPIIYANLAFSALTGYPAEEVIGRNCRFLQGEGSEKEIIQKIHECLRREAECRFTLKNYKKDGTAFWNELMISPMHDADGKLTHFIGVQTDITRRQEAEEALRQGIVRQHALLRDMFASVTEGKLLLCGSHNDLPTPLTRFADPIPLSAVGGIRELRRHTISACVAVEIPDARRYDLETAAGEAAMNAVVHAGSGTGHVFTHERGTVQIRVEDEGKGIAMVDLPNATLQRGYSTAGTMGHGFKMILKTVDRVHLLTGGTGTTVVIEQDRAAPVSAWL